jgi:hypothetical protein
MSNLTENIWAICSTYPTVTNAFNQLQQQSQDKLLK